MKACPLWVRWKTSSGNQVPQHRLQQQKLELPLPPPLSKLPRLHTPIRMDTITITVEDTWGTHPDIRGVHPPLMWMAL